jgi:hypothetical protein
MKVSNREAAAQLRRWLYAATVFALIYSVPLIAYWLGA